MPISVLKTIPTSVIVVVLSLLGTPTLRADPGVFDDRIVFGQSAALKGPAAALGLGMREGILAAFHEANAAGGVHGRKLELISYNGPAAGGGMYNALAIKRFGDGEQE